MSNNKTVFTPVFAPKDAILSNKAISNGYLYVTIDTNEAYVDLKNNRFKIKDISILSYDSERAAANDEFYAGFYYVLETSTFWHAEWNGEAIIWNNLNISGSASTAERLKTEKSITLAGAVTGTVSFDGSEDVTIDTALGEGFTIDADKIDGLSVSWNDIKANTIPSGEIINVIDGIKYKDISFVITDKIVDLSPLSGEFQTKGNYALKSELFSGSYEDLTNKPTIPSSVTQLTDHTNYVLDSSLANVAKSGSYEDLTDKPVIPVKVTDLNDHTNYVKVGDDITGNAATATKLANKRTIELTGAVVGSVGFDGFNNVTINTSLAADIQIDANSISGFTLDYNSDKLLNKPNLTLKADLVNGVVPASQLPSYVDDVIEGIITLTDGNSSDSIEIDGETFTSFESGKIYIDKTTNKQYRWSGSKLVEISSSLALGTTSSTAFYGDRGLAIETKVNGIESGAQVNKIESISVNNTILSISNTKNVNIDLSNYALTTEIPTSVADLSDSDNYALKTDLSNFIIASDDITGNAATATKLKNSRTINIAGAVIGSIDFDGSEDVTIQVDLGSGFTIDASLIKDLTVSWTDIKADTIPSGEIVNVIDEIVFNGNVFSISNKTVDLSSLTNTFQAKGNYALKSDLFSGSYTDLTDKPIIPSSVAQLTDAGNYVLKTELNDLTDGIGSIESLLFRVPEMDVGQFANFRIEFTNDPTFSIITKTIDTLNLEDSYLNDDSSIIGFKVFNGLTLDSFIHSSSSPGLSHVYATENIDLNLKEVFGDTSYLNCPYFRFQWIIINGASDTDPAYGRYGYGNVSGVQQIFDAGGSGEADESLYTALKEKLEGIESGAEKNVIESIKVNNVAQTIDSNRTINIDLSKYTTSSDVKNIVVDEALCAHAADEATKLIEAKNIKIAGAVEGNVDFDGSSDIVINSTLNSEIRAEIDTISGRLIDSLLFKVPYFENDQLLHFRIEFSEDSLFESESIKNVISTLDSVENIEVFTGLGTSAFPSTGLSYLAIGGQVHLSIDASYLNYPFFRFQWIVRFVDEENSTEETIIYEDIAGPYGFGKITGVQQIFDGTDLEPQYKEKLEGIEEEAQVNLIESITFNDEVVSINESTKNATIKANTIESLLFRVPEIEIGQFANFKIEFTNDPEFTTITKTIDTLNIEDSNVENGFIIGFKAFNGLTLDKFAHNSTVPGLEYIYASENIDLNLKEIFGDTSYFDCPYFRFQWIITNGADDADPVYGRYGYGNIGGAQQIFDNINLIDETTSQKHIEIDNFNFSSNTCYRCENSLTDINFQLPDGTLQNAVLTFKTGEYINYLISGSSNYIINKPFIFEPNKRYTILVDHYSIFWCEVQDFLN